MPGKADRLEIQPNLDRNFPNELNEFDQDDFKYLICCRLYQVRSFALVVAGVEVVWWALDLLLCAAVLRRDFWEPGTAALAFAFFISMLISFLALLLAVRNSRPALALLKIAYEAAVILLLGITVGFLCSWLLVGRREGRRVEHERFLLFLAVYLFARGQATVLFLCVYLRLHKFLGEKRRHLDTLGNYTYVVMDEPPTPYTPVCSPVQPELREIWENLQNNNYRRRPPPAFLPSVGRRNLSLSPSELQEVPITPAAPWTPPQHPELPKLIVSNAP